MATINSSSGQITGTTGNDFIFARSATTTVNGGRGNDVIVGDAQDLIESNESRNLDIANNNSLDRSPVTFDFNVPHATISIEAQQNAFYESAFYSAAFGDQITIDIDYADSAVRGGEQVDLIVYVYDVFGNFIDQDNNDEDNIAPDDIGSDGDRDPFLQFDTPYAGTFTIFVERADGLAFTGREKFLMNVSQERQPANSMVPDGNDLLIGGEGDDQVFGVGGNDVIRGGTGDDLLNGGFGTDTASFTDASGGVSVNLATGVAVARGAGNSGRDSIVAIENVAGTKGADVINGNSQRNSLDGSGGNDQLFGADNADTIDGGFGSDVIRGGRGADIITTGADNDRVVFQSGDGRDDILDFANGSDKLDLRSLDLSVADVLDATRAVARGTFVNVPGAADGILLVGFNIQNFDRTDFLV